MARHGLSYDDVKYTAIKLLSQGESPSVQKIRDTLGTGSNTTIAEHLKVWREEHKNQEIHHLPANMPKELVAAIEVLWQTAMEQANNQLVAIKQNLDQREQQMQQEKLTLEMNINELKNRLIEIQQRLDNRNNEAQSLRTELAIAQEKLVNSSEELVATKQQYELRLNHISDEKYLVVEKADNLQKELAQWQQQLSDQADKHQAILIAERARQEQSEKRWLNLIDQARQETKKLQKIHEATINNQSKKTEVMQTNIADYQHKIIMQQATLDHQNATIAELKAQLSKINDQYVAANFFITTLKSTQKRKIKKINNFSRSDIITNL